MCMKWFCGGPLTPEEGLDLLSPVRRALMVAVQTFITGPQREPTVRSGKEEAADVTDGGHRCVRTGSLARTLNAAPSCRCPSSYQGHIAPYTNQNALENLLLPTMVLPSLGSRLKLKISLTVRSLKYR
ncbi:hypothetical protein HZH68_016024 [Vespula germanica]|uniref:Uncharacterized protein n=1 Tax=Vespula germanica TaxID=30212 RepID=A0A834J678_VESGE|nr:hypothetical protein HZH68_016024 [Vespula germanica]